MEYPTRQENGEGGLIVPKIGFKIPKIFPNTFQIFLTLAQKFSKY